MNIVTDLKQKHVEAWSLAYEKETGGGQFVVNGAIVRCAIDAEIITGLERDDVGDMKPYEVTELANQVSEMIVEANKPPEKKQ